MTKRSNHYEAAFEDYLRSKGLPYVAVDEAKKAIFGKVALKSFDVIVYSEQGPNLLVDVKGRRFPDSIPGQRRSGKAWENWITRDDVESLTDWQGVFGEGFSAALVFAYCLQGPPQRSPFEDVHIFRENYYAFVAVSLAEYVQLAKPRSRKWQTLAIPAKTFQQTARDIATLI